MLSTEKQRVCKAILNVFETGKVTGDYTAAAILADGAGISYGAKQGTDGGGTLDLIVLRYIEAGGVCADRLRGFVDFLGEDGSTLVDPKRPETWPARLHELLALLREAGKDPVMVRVQEAIFEEEYWIPAIRHAESMGLVEPLSFAVLYDTCIQSGPAGVSRIRMRFREVPPVRGGYERAWTKAYCVARRAWLAGYPNERVQVTVRRPDTFLRLIEAGNWSLDTPLEVYGRKIA